MCHICLEKSQTIRVAMSMAPNTLKLPIYYTLLLHIKFNKSFWDFEQALWVLKEMNTEEKTGQRKEYQVW